MHLHSYVNFLLYLDKMCRFYISIKYVLIILKKIVFKYEYLRSRLKETTLTSKVTSAVCRLQFKGILVDGSKHWRDMQL